MNILNDLEENGQSHRRKIKSCRSLSNDHRLTDSNNIINKERDSKHSKFMKRCETIHLINKPTINTKIKKKVKFKEIFEDIVYIENCKSAFPSFRLKKKMIIIMKKSSMNFLIVLAGLKIKRNSKINVLDVV